MFAPGHRCPTGISCSEKQKTPGRLHGSLFIEDHLPDDAKIQDIADLWCNADLSDLVSGHLRSTLRLRHLEWWWMTCIALQAVGGIWYVDICGKTHLSPKKPRFWLYGNNPSRCKTNIFGLKVVWIVKTFSYWTMFFPAHFPADASKPQENQSGPKYHRNTLERSWKAQFLRNDQILQKKSTINHTKQLDLKPQWCGWWWLMLVDVGWWCHLNVTIPLLGPRTPRCSWREPPCNALPGSRSSEFPRSLDSYLAWDLHTKSELENGRVEIVINYSGFT